MTPNSKPIRADIEIDIEKLVQVSGRWNETQGEIENDITEHKETQTYLYNRRESSTSGKSSHSNER